MAVTSKPLDVDERAAFKASLMHAGLDPDAFIAVRQAGHLVEGDDAELNLVLVTHTVKGVAVSRVFSAESEVQWIAEVVQHVRAGLL